MSYRVIGWEYGMIPEPPEPRTRTRMSLLPVSFSVCHLPLHFSSKMLDRTSYTDRPLPVQPPTCTTMAASHSPMFPFILLLLYTQTIYNSTFCFRIGTGNHVCMLRNGWPIGEGLVGSTDQIWITVRRNGGIRMKFALFAS